MSGRISTHVLDTSRAVPASGIKVELRLLGQDAEGGRLLASGVTGADGRVPQPLWNGDLVPGGEYELTFWAGDYFREQAAAGGIPFLDLVPVRFKVSKDDDHYHIPLLLAPGGYSTYRGC
ncbi:5-hydroxyisourate hydrolase [Paenibacillus rhizosphaerae]|uniref:5-hydroxyisourate hydrolase n=1 Tax=Paenibacillus rhizosphaerae TaxID=297318 RepID=A0A839TN89_9BACL|nr:hydroxyisourate hydrolase [Paenibacillus rhizosphaerae]MBB3127993.1 5-hydroxyisourate hydrolase [Paenibacillus rhizosphaerae]